MLKAMVAAALFTFAAPAFGGAKDDVKDAQKDAVDTAKGTLWCGENQAAREADGAGREAQGAPHRGRRQARAQQVTGTNRHPFDLDVVSGHAAYLPEPLGFERWVAGEAGKGDGTQQHRGHGTICPPQAGPVPGGGLRTARR
jgi:hypothetical protein